MTTYNTGNPIGSAEVKDLYDNAENLDIAINSPSADVWTDRLGQARKTWRGIQSEAQLEIAQVVGEVTAQSQQYLDASIVARDEARAAASASGPIAFYGTYAAAQAAVGGLPDGGIVEVSQDETRAGARTRYKVQTGALVFLVNLDQVRIDLASTVGAAIVGFQQSGAGAVPRKVQDKSREIVSRADYASGEDFDAGKGSRPSIDGDGVFDAHVLPADAPTALPLSAVLTEAMRGPKVSALRAGPPNALARDIHMIGDSISHGAFALNTYLHGWARIFNRMVNAEVGASSYGFTNLLTLGSGVTQTTEIHSVNFVGSWSAVAATSEQASASPSGSAMRSGGVGGQIQITVPFFQNRLILYYLNQPGGGQFTVSINGSVVQEVSTSAVAIGLGSVEVALADGDFGSTAITLAHTGAGTVDIVGPAYLASVQEPVFHNFSNTGRRLRYAGQSVLSDLMSRSSVFIMALGHNDQMEADSDAAYYAAFVQRIDWIIQAARLNGATVVVPDFCWLAPSTSRTRKQLRRLATETGGVYVDLPGAIFGGDVPVNAAHLTDTLKMWTDSSHPNKGGMKWIAESVAKAMRLSCSSKRDALAIHDFWLPLALKPGTGVKNQLGTVMSNISAFRRSGNSIVIKLYLRNIASGAGAFPVGSYSLTDGFTSKAEAFGFVGQSGPAVVNSTDGSVVSNFYLSASGALTLRVGALWIADQSFNIVVPGGD